MGSIHSGPRAGLYAQRIFFPAAALFAAVAPWLLLSGVLGFAPVVDVGTHARGLLFGYVGALIAGYLVGKLSARAMGLLFGLWLGGRLAETTSDSTALINLLYAAYGVLLAVHVVPRFSAAKKWRNRLTGPLLALIACFPLLYWGFAASGRALNFSLYGLILLIALLMFFMGGRFITPALAVAFAREGQRLPQRVQPWIEGTTMVLLLLASGAYLWQPGQAWIAAPVLAAAVLIWVRVLRWQLFALSWHYAEIWALGVGYLWLGLGLLLFALSLLGYLPGVAGVHVITVGALGTLSSAVMLKLSAKKATLPQGIYVGMMVLIAGATGLRFAANFAPLQRELLLGMSALAWSAGLALIAWTIMRRNREIQGNGR